MNAQAKQIKRAAAPQPDPGTAATIPLSKLVLSELNARKTYPDEDVIGLSENIHERGLHQNLVVSKSPTLRGYFEVDAGGRRFHALKRNVKLGRLAPDWPVPVKIVPREEAAEASLDENIQKIALNPADEFAAYARIIAGYEAEGMTDPAERIAQCARRRGVPVRHVAQRLRLAALAPEILDALRDGKITLDAAKAYAGHPDHKLQMKIFAAEEKKGNWGHGPVAIKDALKGKIYTSEHKAVIYAGLDAYLAAGGRIETDLFFGAEDRRVLLDPSIVDRLCAEKSAAEAKALAEAAGWADGAVKPWNGQDWADPKTPKGFTRKWGGLADGDDEGRAQAIAWFKLAEDGSHLEIYENSCFVPEKPAAAAGAARTSHDHEAEWAARTRKLLIETTAARLAIPSIAGTPLEGRAHWPDRFHGINALTQEEDGSFTIALLVRVSAEDVAAMREQAEWTVAEEEAAEAAAAKAETAAPGPEDEEKEEEPVEAKAPEAVS